MRPHRSTRCHRRLATIGRERRHSTTAALRYIAENSIFDAKPYSLTGQVLPKDNYNRITSMVATFGGPIRIPPLFYHGPNFFLALSMDTQRQREYRHGSHAD